MTGPLQGGRRRRHVGPKRRIARRRRAGARLAVTALLLAPLVVAGAAYLSFLHEGGQGARGPAPMVAGAIPRGSVPPPAGGALEPRSPAPIRLTGVDAFGLRFREAEVRPSMGSGTRTTPPCQSFSATLDRRPFATQVEARLAVFEFIEG